MRYLGSGNFGTPDNPEYNDHVDALLDKPSINEFGHKKFGNRRVTRSCGKVDEYPNVQPRTLEYKRRNVEE